MSLSVIHLGHEYVKIIKNIIEKNDLNKDVSLFTGLAGINYAIHHTSENRTRYTEMLIELDSHLNTLGNRFLKDIISVNNYLTRGTIELGYDLITGITGIGCYILKSGNSKLYHLLDCIILHLIKLSKSIVIDNINTIGFLTSNEIDDFEETKEKFPHGYLNIGLSHGIAGPLSLLSLAYKNGFKHEGQLSAIKVLADCIIGLTNKDKNGFYIERMIGLEDLNKVHNERTVNNTRFDAWCYGGFGVVHALTLANSIIRSEPIERVIFDLLNGILNSEVDEWNVNSPIICHGYAGN